MIISVLMLATSQNKAVCGHVLFYVFIPSSHFQRRTGSMNNSAKYNIGFILTERTDKLAFFPHFVLSGLIVTIKLVPNYILWKLLFSLSNLNRNHINCVPHFPPQLPNDDVLWYVIYSWFAGKSAIFVDKKCCICVTLLSMMTS